VQTIVSCVRTQPAISDEGGYDNASRRIEAWMAGDGPHGHGHGPHRGQRRAEDRGRLVDRVGGRLGRRAVPARRARHRLARRARDGQPMAEVTILAQQSGITREAFLACLFEPTFTSKLLRKDFGLGLTAARERQVPMPVSATVHELIQGLVGRGYGDVDFAAFIQQEAESAGITLESEHAEVSDGLDSDDS